MSRRLPQLILITVVAFSLVACGSAASPAVPSTSIAPGMTVPTSSVAPSSVPASVVPAGVLLQPGPAVNSYYCVTELDIGANAERLWTTIVRNQAAWSLRHDWVHEGKSGSILIVRIGNKQWENVGQGYKVSKINTALQRTALSFDAPTLFTRFFVKTTGLRNFDAGYADNRSNISSTVYRAKPEAKAAMIADEAIGKIDSASYAVSVDGSVLVEANISGQDKSGEDFYFALACNQYNDPQWMIKAPTN